MSGTHVSEKYIVGLDQLFRSNRAHWQHARRLLSNGESNSKQNTSIKLPEVVRGFLNSTSQLQADQLTFPSFFKPQSQLDSTSPLFRLTTETTQNSASSVHIKHKKSSVFKALPCETLFEFQVLQQEQEPRLNHYGLLIDWNTQTDSEFKDASRILLFQLRTPGDSHSAQKLRLHAACRFLSELTELSIETLASLPIYRHGSMHVDLKCGLIRRDITVVAPRTDRVKGLRWLRRWLRTPIPPEILAVLRETVSNCPMARTVGDLMIAAELTPKICHLLLNEGRLESRVHESLRVARSLLTFMLVQGIHASIVSRAFGVIKMMPVSHHYYLALEQVEVYGAINMWCNAIGLTPIDIPGKATLIGSPKAPSFEVMARSFQIIQKENNKDRMSITSRSSLTEIIQFHNNFVSRFTLQLLWAEGGRCQNLSRFTAKLLFADGSHVVISDRDSDRYAQWRPCPLSPILQRSRLNFVSHLLAMSRWLEKRGEPDAANALSRIADGTDPNVGALPILFRQKNKTLAIRPVTRIDLQKVKTSSPINELNEPRHFLITELDRRKIAPIAINAQVGHHHTGAPPFGVGSGMSISEFSSYMMPKLERLHEDLGLQPLAGLGITELARLKLPKLRLPDVLAAPENHYLAQRLEIEDFNPPDIYFAEEDCPISPLTLPARDALVWLTAKYLKSNVIGKHAWGALCFCMISFDLVINLREMEQFFNRLLTGSEVSIGNLNGVEVFNLQDPLPIGQCLLSTYSVDALKVARSSGMITTFLDALCTLEELLLSLDPGWPKIGGDATARRLQSMAMHHAMVDLPSVSRFSVTHKSPFIPLGDIRRIVYGQTTPIAPPCLHRLTGNPSRDFKKQVDLVDRWADKDTPSGEYGRRANGLLHELDEFEANNVTDDMDLLLHDLIRAELGKHPPYRRLKLYVLSSYLKIQLQFFRQARSIGNLPRTPEDWASFIHIFTDAKNNVNGPRHWAGLHLGAWLNFKGYSVPPALMQGGKHRVNYKPHLSVYVTSVEIERAIYILQQSGLQHPMSNWLPALLRLQRGCVLRPEESRFLKAKHLSLDGHHLLITTSGHNHLKNDYARGIVTVPNKQRDALLIHKDRRAGSPEGMSASMFVPAGTNGYIEYDKLACASRTVLQGITGRGDFRLYDFRASAITDVMIDIPAALLSLASGKPIDWPQLTSATLISNFARGATAAREARQSNVITPLRYYYLGGNIENRLHLNSAQLDLTPSPSYLSVVLGKSPGAVSAQRFRVARGAKARTCPSKDTLATSCWAQLIDAPFEPRTAQLQHMPGESLLLAGLLALSGLETKPAADAASIAAEKLDEMLPEFKAAMAKVGITSLHHTAAKGSSSWFSMLDKLSTWAFIHRMTLLEFTSRSPKGVRIYKGKLSFSNHVEVIASQELWAGLVAIGVRPLLIFGNSVAPSIRTTAKDELQRLGITTASSAVTRQKYASMRFCLSAAKEEPDCGTDVTISNHQMGKTGRLVVAAMTLAIALIKKELLWQTT